ncbi:MAG: serine/threonine-protein kinase, partial [Myxococcota bacterium]
MAAVQQFGKYALVNRLAVGGMAEVFRAKLLGEAGFERMVALKRILPNFSSDQDFITMFIDEARIAGRLTHGNIVQTIELGRYDDTYYIAMELVEGMDLSALIAACKQRGLKPSVELACFVTAEACRGLAYAHEARDENGNPLGIIHRDISPQNILLSVNGDVKISDFGIAKALDRVGNTSAGVIKGKGGYMPPEQFDGEAIDHRADLYALGVVFYELLTFEHLHNFPVTHDFGEKLRRAPPPVVSQVNPDCGPALDAILQRCVAPDPKDRYPDAGTLERQIMRYLHGYAGGFSQTDLAEFIKQNLAHILDDPFAAIPEEEIQHTTFQPNMASRMEVLFAQQEERKPRSTSTTQPVRKTPVKPVGTPVRAVGESTMAVDVSSLPGGRGPARPTGTPVGSAK